MVEQEQPRQYVGLAASVERAELEQHQRHAEVMEQFQALRKLEWHDELSKELQALLHLQQLQQAQLQQLQQQLQQQEAHKELQQQQELLHGLQRELRQQRQQRDGHWQLQEDRRQQQQQQQHQEQQERPNYPQKELPEQPTQKEQKEPQKSVDPSPGTLEVDLSPGTLEVLQRRLAALLDEHLGPQKWAQPVDLSPGTLEALQHHLAALLDEHLGSSGRKPDRSPSGGTLYGAPEQELVALRTPSTVSTPAARQDPKTFGAVALPVFEEPVQNHIACASTFLKCSMCLVVLNAIFLGVEIEWTIDCARRRIPKPAWLYWVSLSFSAAFTIEILLRVCTERRAFWAGKAWRWNFFDTMLIMDGWIGLLADTLDFSGWRALRVVRVLRLAKVLRYLRKPRLIAASLCTSLPSMLWGFLLLISTLYMFAVFFFQSIEEDVRTSGVAGDPLDTYYGSMGRTMLCLFQAISGGNDWHVFLRPLGDASSWHLVPLFVFYVAFVLFFIMNILTAIVVDGARHIAMVDVDLHVLEESDKERAMLKSIQRYLPDSFIIAREDLKSKLGMFESQQFFRGVGVDNTHVMLIYDLLETGAEDGVTKEQLSLAILRLRSAAAGADVAMLMVELQRLHLSVSSVLKDVASGFVKMDADMRVLLNGRNDSMPPFTSLEDVNRKHSLARFKALETMLSPGAADGTVISGLSSCDL